MNAYTPTAMPDLCKTVKNGIFYTPDHVALELVSVAKQFLDVSATLSVLDPACGDGALLQASMDELGDLHRFLGCDLFPPDSQRWVKGMNFHQGDFFEFQSGSKYDLVITNPPYIQFGRLDSQQRKELQSRFSKELHLSGTVDLWVYFLLKAASHLRHGGVIAAVIPWSFLEADFSHLVREWFSEHFEDIRVLVLRDRHFSTTEKRVLLLWVAGYGRSAQNIEIGFSERVDDQHRFQAITRDEWVGPRLITGVDIDSDRVLKQCRENGWLELGTVAKIGIGVVTGSNAFFIRPSGTHGVRDKTPILTKVDDLQCLEVFTYPDNELLFLDSRRNPDSAYIQQGITDGIPKRSHCQRRGELWYKVNADTAPDAFFTYRVARTPYLSLNPEGFYCTNSLHKVSFNQGVTENMRKWIALSILSDISQLSLEMNGRHYGNGVLKIEPSALKAALVKLPSRRISESRFNKVSELICAGRKDEAAAEATAYCKEVCDFPEHIWDQARTALQKIRARRK